MNKQQLFCLIIGLMVVANMVYAITAEPYESPADSRKIPNREIIIPFPTIITGALLIVVGLVAGVGILKWAKIL